MSGVAPLTFNNTEFKPCDATLPGPVDCIMNQTTGQQNQAMGPSKAFSKIIAPQSWPAARPVGSAALNLAYWHTPWMGYFNSEQAVVCGADKRVGLDNTCWGADNVPVTVASLSPPFSSNPGPYNMNNGKYLFELTQPVSPLTGTGITTAQVLVRDRDC
jgi:hypothetical protein